VSLSILFYVGTLLNFVSFLSSTDKYEEQRRTWGGGIRGNKSTQMMRKRAKAAGQTLSAANAAKL
jgi:hypothetical protein